MDPYSVIKHRHVTEKTVILEGLKNATSNPSVSRCESSKYVFLVDSKANKHEIAKAVEALYSNQNAKVTKVNTINTKAKKRRVRGRLGKRSAFKKAIVTLEESLDEV